MVSGLPSRQNRFESDIPLFWLGFQPSSNLGSMKKICSQCKLEKETSDFHKKTASRFRDRCKACAKIYHRAHYLANKQRYVDSAQRTLAKVREFVDELKRHPCTDCGKTWPPIAMDFDHVSGEKTGNISTLIGNGSLATIKKELAKCELVCACCHRLRTARRYPGG